MRELSRAKKLLATSQYCAAAAFALTAAISLNLGELGAQSNLSSRPSSQWTTAVDLTVPAPLGRINAVRELSGGRLIVLEGIDRAIFLVDEVSGDVRQLGRIGDGPGEYRYPALAFAAGVDSTLVLDGENRKWYMLHGDAFLSTSDAMRKLQISMMTVLAGIDRYGNALELEGIGSWSRTEPLRMIWQPWFADSLRLLRHRPNGQVDTLTRLRGQYLGMNSRVQKRVNGEAISYSLFNPLQSYDQAVMFSSGAIAVAYFSPYRVDWRSPDGVWTRGRPVPIAAAAVTLEVRRDVARGYRRDNNGRSVFEPEDFPPWPKVVPPFVRESVMSGSDGRMYVKRTRLRDDEPQVIDIFDASTERIASVALPPAYRFIGAGIRGIYVATRNEDDEEQLVRLRLVRGSR